MKLSVSFIAPVLLMFTRGVQRPLILCFFSEKTIVLVLVGIYNQHLQGTFILNGLWILWSCAQFVMWVGPVGLV